MTRASMAAANQDEALWATFSREERRLAFHAKLWSPSTRRFSAPLAAMHSWVAALPLAVERQNLAIDEGAQPTRFTLRAVLGPDEGRGELCAAVHPSGREGCVVAAEPYFVEHGVVGGCDVAGGVRHHGLVEDGRFSAAHAAHELAAEDALSVGVARAADGPGAGVG